MNYLIFATTNGIIKKTQLEEYSHIRPSGLVAIKLDKDNQLLSVKPTDGKDEVMLVSQNGKSIRFKESGVRPTGRATRGVRGIKLKKDDHLVSMQVITNQENIKLKKKTQEELLSTQTDQLLVVTENGYGKRSPLKNYSVQGRGGQGVYTAKTSSKTGKVVGAYLVSSEDTESDLLIISRAGKTIRLPLKQVPELGRHTQGVRLFRLDHGDTAASLTLL